MEPQNAFFHRTMQGTRVLLVVPHEDDEINVLGDVTVSFQQNGAQVFVVFVTNGDFFLSGSIRIREAAKSLAVLGVPSDRIHFLGYPDALNGEWNSHLYNAVEEPYKSHAGFTHTYGGAGFSDYSYDRTGAHRPYLRESVLQDLRMLLHEIQPDMIFTIGYDIHADHRMTSLLIDHAVGELLARAGNTYRPLLFHGFAYSTSYFAPSDFFQRNLPSTRKADETVSFDFCGIQDFGADHDMMGRFHYVWEERVRFPVRKESRRLLFFRNLLARALLCHRSQGAIWKFEGIANGDKVFFQRRTDNLLYHAAMQASSNGGDAQRALAFSLYDARDIEALVPDLVPVGWEPETGDESPTLSFVFPESTSLCLFRVAAFCRADGKLPRLSYRLDDGPWQPAGSLAGQGRYTCVQLPEGTRATRIALRFLEGAGFSVIAAECFRAQAQNGPITVVKILVEDTFAYRYYASAKEPSRLSLYTFPKRDDIHIVGYDGQGRKLHQLHEGDLEGFPYGITILQAEDVSGRVYDLVVLDTRLWACIMQDIRVWCGRTLLHAVHFAWPYLAKAKKLLMLRI